MTAPTTERTVLDKLHAVRMEDPRFDSKAHAQSALNSALWDVVSALAYLENNPARASYVEMLAEVLAEHEPDEERELVLTCRAIVTAVGWVEDAIEEEM